MADGDANAHTIPVARCELSLSDASWDFAEVHKDEIARHWARARIERPKLYDGTVYLLSSWQLQAETLCGSFVRTDFKSFFYWRETGHPEAGVWDGFGSSLIVSADGAVLLGQQTEGHMNTGLAYPPSGMIDASDADAGGIDIDGSIARELDEETGLGPAQLDRTPGYLVTLAGPHISIAIEWRSRLAAEALRERILAHAHAQSAPELADIVIVRQRRELDGLAMPAYARALLRRILSA